MAPRGRPPTTPGEIPLHRLARQRGGNTRRITNAPALIITAGLPSTAAANMYTRRSPIPWPSDMDLPSSPPIIVRGVSPVRTRQVSTPHPNRERSSSAPPPARSGSVNRYYQEEEENPDATLVVDLDELSSSETLVGSESSSEDDSDSEELETESEDKSEEEEDSEEGSEASSYDEESSGEEDSESEVGDEMQDVVLDYASSSTVGVEERVGIQRDEDVKVEADTDCDMVMNDVPKHESLIGSDDSLDFINSPGNDGTNDMDALMTYAIKSYDSDGNARNDESTDEERNQVRNEEPNKTQEAGKPHLSDAPDIPQVRCPGIREEDFSAVSQPILANVEEPAHTTAAYPKTPTVRYQRHSSRLSKKQMEDELDDLDSQGSPSPARPLSHGRPLELSPGQYFFDSPVQEVDELEGNTYGPAVSPTETFIKKIKKEPGLEEKSPSPEYYCPYTPAYHTQEATVTKEDETPALKGHVTSPEFSPVLNGTARNVSPHLLPEQLPRIEIEMESEEDNDDDYYSRLPPAPGLVTTPRDATAHLSLTMGAHADGTEDDINLTFGERKLIRERRSSKGHDGTESNKKFDDPDSPHTPPKCRARTARVNAKPLPGLSTKTPVQDVNDLNMPMPPPSEFDSGQEQTPPPNIKKVYVTTPRPVPAMNDRRSQELQKSIELPKYAVPEDDKVKDQEISDNDDEASVYPSSPPEMPDSVELPRHKHINVRSFEITKGPSSTTHGSGIAALENPQLRMDPRKIAAAKLAESKALNARPTTKTLKPQKQNSVLLAAAGAGSKAHKAAVAELTQFLKKPAPTSTPALRLRPADATGFVRPKEVLSKPGAGWLRRVQNTAQPIRTHLENEVIDLPPAMPMRKKNVLPTLKVEPPVIQNRKVAQPTTRRHRRSRNPDDIKIPEVINGFPKVYWEEEARYAAEIELEKAARAVNPWLKAGESNVLVPFHRMTCGDLALDEDEAPSPVRGKSKKRHAPVEFFGRRSKRQHMEGSDSHTDSESESSDDERCSDEEEDGVYKTELYIPLSMEEQIEELEEKRVAMAELLRRFRQPISDTTDDSDAVTHHGMFKPPTKRLLRRPGHYGGGIFGGQYRFKDPEESRKARRDQKRFMNRARELYEESLLPKKSEEATIHNTENSVPNKTKEAAKYNTKNSVSKKSGVVAIHNAKNYNSKKPKVNIWAMESGCALEIHLYGKNVVDGKIIKRQKPEGGK